MYDSSGLKKFWLCSGYGMADYKLESFDKALLNSGIGDYNLIKLSSILPPSCINCSDQEFPWSKGSLIPVAYASKTFHSIECFSPVSAKEYASVSVAVPENKILNGLIMEHSGRESDVSHQMALNGMNNRNRKIKEIIDEQISCEVEMKPDFTDGKYSAFGIIFKQLNGFTSIEKYRDCYITLFACCVLG